MDMKTQKGSAFEIFCRISCLSDSEVLLYMKKSKRIPNVKGITIFKTFFAVSDKLVQ
jgi:hypothetical protein